MERKKFKKAYIEITNICNLKCDFCPGTNRELRYMGKEEFIRIIYEVKPFTDYIYFHLMGEPLLNPELESFLGICGENKLKVNITTNGILLKGRKELLTGAPALRKVSISLHSFEANSGKKCGKLKFETYLTEIIDFVKEADRKGIICEFRLWNADSEGIKGSNKLNRDILFRLKQEFKLDFDLQTATLQHQNIKLENNIFLQTAQKFEWPDIKRDIIGENVFCYGLRDQFAVLVDGTVVPCCLDSEGSISLGNIFEQPLEEILNTPRAQNIYKGFTARTAVEELCKKCGYAGRHKRS